MFFIFFHVIWLFIIWLFIIKIITKAEKMRKIPSICFIENLNESTRKSGGKMKHNLKRLFIRSIHWFKLMLNSFQMTLKIMTFKISIGWWFFYFEYPFFIEHFSQEKKQKHKNSINHNFTKHTSTAKPNLMQHKI